MRDDEIAGLRETLLVSQDDRRELEAANDLLRSRLQQTEKASQHSLEKVLAHETQLAINEARLKATEAELGRISNSLGWRLLTRYGTIKYRYLLRLYRLLGLSRYVNNGDARD